MQLLWDATPKLVNQQDFAAEFGRDTKYEIFISAALVKCGTILSTVRGIV